MTYDSLTAAIPLYTDRSATQDTNFAAQFDSFILLAQQRLVVDLDKNLGLQSYATGSFTTGINVYTKPAGWRRNITLSYLNSGVITPIDIRTYEYCESYSPNPTIEGPPKFYADYAYDKIYVVPAPDAGYVYTWGILALPTILSSGNQSNWFTDNAPNALLAATIWEALDYLQNYEQIPEWEKKYTQAIAALQEQNDVRVTDRASDRSSTP